MGKIRQIILLVSQIALLVFAVWLCWNYTRSVEPVYMDWYTGVINSNPAKIILGPVLSIFILLSTFALGRFMWERLGGINESSNPTASFLQYSATGLAVLAFISWLSLIPGWSLGGLLFFIMLVVLVVEINPTIEAFTNALSLPFERREGSSVRWLRLLYLPIIIAGTVAPFLDSITPVQSYLNNPGESFATSFSHIPIGLDIPLYSLCADLAGTWAIPAINLALTWLIIIGILEISRRLFDSLPAGLLGGILLLCIPFQATIIRMPSEGLVLAFFLITAFAALTQFLFEDDLSGLVAAGLFLGFALSVSAKGAPFAVVFLIYATIAVLLPRRKGIIPRLGALLVFIVLFLICGSLLGVQNHYIADDVLYPVRSAQTTEFDIPLQLDDKGNEIPLTVDPVPPQGPSGVSFPEKYGGFAGVGYKLTMSTDGDLSKGPQGLGPLFMAFIPGILLIMITRRHTKQAWSLILLLLLYYLFAVYIQRGFSLESVYAIFPFQALLTGYIIDRLYLLSKLDEKRWISYIFLILFIPAVLFLFFWTCSGYGIVPVLPAS